MNGNYQINRFYAQERVNAQLKAAEEHRRARSANRGSSVRFIAGRVYSRVMHTAGQLAHPLEALGKARVAPLGR